MHESCHGPLEHQCGDCLYERAKELLEACQAAIPILHWASCHGSRCDELLAQVQAAIAKATPAARKERP